MKIKSRILRPVAGALLMGAVLAGCQDLNVPNTNAPDRIRALSSASDVETLVASSWRDHWGRVHTSGSTVNVLPLVADEMSGTYANNAALELSSEPRPPLNNVATADAHALGRFQWEDWYKAISSVNDGLGAIADGLIIKTGEEGEEAVDNTLRTKAFAKWMQAIAHGYLSILFDQAFVVDEDTDLEFIDEIPLLPYQEVRDAAIGLMEEAIDIMATGSFTTPTSWIPSRSYTPQQLSRIGHSYIVRFLVYGARTPEERAALDWNKVLQHLDQGITEDYEVDLESGVLTSSAYSRYQTSGTFSAYGDYKLIGPADVSGAFRAWLDKPLAERERFQIVTPDRRITGATPASNGAYYYYRSNNIFRPERGLYHHSHYQWRRHFQQYGATTLSSTGVAKLMTVDEMNLIRAEALIRLNRAAEAVPLINITRERPRTIAGTQYPGIPPVTVAGVPQSDDCVPRMDGVTCADLEGALMYERMIEGAMLDIIRGYADSRGWGRLPEGTFIHLPIPARQLEAMNMPIYSFGGIGGPGTAPCVWPFCG